MANPRLPSDFWDGEEEELHYPNATPRRVALAHALGVVGVLGTLTLAGFAFAPRMPAITSRFQGLFSKEAPALNPAKPVAQVPVAQVQAPVPPPLVTSVEVAPVAPAVVPSTVPSTQPSSASDTATAPEATTAPEAVAPPPAPTTEPVATEPVATSTPAPVARSRPHGEPPLTAREIERRQQRYEMWLRREGLEPVH